MAPILTHILHPRSGLTEFCVFLHLKPDVCLNFSIHLVVHIWRLLTRNLAFLDVKDLIISSFLMYQVIIFERRLGSHKFITHMIGKLILTTILELCAEIGPILIELPKGIPIEFPTGIPIEFFCESVIDGGGLLYAVTWQPFSTLKQVIYQYYSYVTSNYGISSTVVFDGYIDGPSVKDHEHNRRIMASGAHIQIEHHATKRRSPDIDIGKTSNSLNPHVLKYLLVIQAVSGCDATSAIFDQGKPSIIKLVEKSKKARNFCDILMSSDSTVKEVGGPGIGLWVLMYSGRENDTLSHLRFVNYMKMTATSKKQLQPEKLPPTKRASWFHSLRVYHQICHWKSLKDEKDPLEWGWEMEDGKMSPIMTDQVLSLRLVIGMSWPGLWQAGGCVHLTECSASLEVDFAPMKLSSEVNQLKAKFGVIFPLLVDFYYDVPRVTHHYVFGIPITGKSFVYLMTLNVLSGSTASLMSGICAVIAGLLHRSNFLKIQEIVVIPKFLSNLTAKTLGRILFSSSPRNNSTMMGATLELQRQQLLDLMEQSAVTQQMHETNNLYQQGQGYSVTPMGSITQQANNSFSWLRRRTNVSEEAPEQMVRTLVEMGFDRQSVLAALRSSNNNLTIATSILLNER
ncbi:Ubiquitin-associated domain-containing protein 2 [Nymphon striatum]|nr:Ubiquitin-associated domain-containing protein 2 [Nymphon striatum]